MEGCTIQFCIRVYSLQCWGRSTRYNTLILFANIKMIPWGSKIVFQQFLQPPKSEKQVAVCAPIDPEKISSRQCIMCAVVGCRRVRGDSQ